MASVRAAARLTPGRPHLLRPSPVTRTAHLVRRTYASEQGRRPATDQKPVDQAEEAQEDLTDESDPNMNGQYPDPNLTSALPLKRSLRDPYADWWDPIERRNYGEPVHEDNDILGVFSTEEYTHFTTRWGFVLMGAFIASLGALSGVVYKLYPDRPAAPRTFPGGLEDELGGPKAVRARKSEDEESVL